MTNRVIVDEHESKRTVKDLAAGTIFRFASRAPEGKVYIKVVSSLVDDMGKEKVAAVKLDDGKLYVFGNDRAPVDILSGVTLETEK